jgi:glucose-1-phosphate cytidylyltransferase
VEIGGRPILWHIMKIYATHGVTDASSAAATGHVIAIYGLPCAAPSRFDLRNNRDVATMPSRDGHAHRHGRSHMTGGRLRRVRANT